MECNTCVDDDVPVNTTADAGKGGGGGVDAAIAVVMMNGYGW
jgi:hypothetical protein